MKVVSNSSPLIALAKINKLHILKDMFDEIFIPKSGDKIIEELKKIHKI